MKRWLREIATWFLAVAGVLREVVGWFLVGLGLLLAAICLSWLQEGRILEVGPMTMLAIIIFRGGIHLLKVAVAARVCMQAAEQMSLAQPVPRPAPARSAGPTPVTRGS